jgi:hypothetical protein
MLFCWLSILLTSMSCIVFLTVITANAHTHELLWLSAKQYRSYIYSSSYDWSKTIQLILVSSYDSQHNPQSACAPVSTSELRVTLWYLAIILKCAASPVWLLFQWANIIHIQVNRLFHRSYIYSSSYNWSKTIQLILVSSYDSQHSNILVVVQYLLTDIT